MQRARRFLGRGEGKGKDKGKYKDKGKDNGADDEIVSDEIGSMWARAGFSSSPSEEVRCDDDDEIASFSDDGGTGKGTSKDKGKGNVITP